MIWRYSHVLKEHRVYLGVRQYLKECLSRSNRVATTWYLGLLARRDHEKLGTLTVAVCYWKGVIVSIGSSVGLGLFVSLNSVRSLWCAPSGTSRLSNLVMCISPFVPYQEPIRFGRSRGASGATYRSGIETVNDHEVIMFAFDRRWSIKRFGHLWTMHQRSDRLATRIYCEIICE